MLDRVRLRAMDMRSCDDWIGFGFERWVWTGVGSCSALDGGWLGLAKGTVGFHRSDLLVPNFELERSEVLECAGMSDPKVVGGSEGQRVRDEVEVMSIDGT